MKVCHALAESDHDFLDLLLPPVAPPDTGLQSEGPRLFPAYPATADYLTPAATTATRTIKGEHAINADTTVPVPPGVDALAVLDAIDIDALLTDDERNDSGFRIEAHPPATPMNFVEAMTTTLPPEHWLSPLDVMDRMQVNAAALSRPTNYKRCSFPGCEKASQSRGKCIRHGGGKRCIVDGCTRGAQATGRCKAHGGGVRCKVEGCVRSSQGAGLCRTHGGGKLCTYPGCKKGTQRAGKCSTHGGARICTVSGCMKVDRGGGLCGEHKKLKTSA